MDDDGMRRFRRGRETWWAVNDSWKGKAGRDGYDCVVSRSEGMVAVVLRGIRSFVYSGERTCLVVDEGRSKRRKLLGNFSWMGRGKGRKEERTQRTGIWVRKKKKV